MFYTLIIMVILFVTGQKLQKRIMEEYKKYLIYKIPDRLVPKSVFTETAAYFKDNVNVIINISILRNRYDSELNNIYVCTIVNEDFAGIKYERGNPYISGLYTYPGSIVRHLK